MVLYCMVLIIAILRPADHGDVVETRYAAGHQSMSQRLGHQRTIWLLSKFKIGDWLGAGDVGGGQVGGREGEGGMS